MAISEQRLRLMAVHAHPDDESSKGAATMARYVDEGHEVMVVSCTGGERGSILNPAMERADVAENLVSVRKEEMALAAKVLGVRHHWLGFIDSGLPEGDPLPPLPEGSFAARAVAEEVPELVRVIRDFRPHVVVTYDEKGGYPHPDHVRSHEVSVAAFDAAGDPGFHPEHGPAWQPQKLYYVHGFFRSRLEAVNAAMERHGLPAPFAEWLAKWPADRPDNFERVTTRVRCENYFPSRDEALRSHATQVDPTGRWFTTPLQVEQEAWPTEDYELVRSLVEVPDVEDDLFAGLYDCAPIATSVGAGVRD